eukprot:CAMPEP_0172546730 /NCGR_PEP_ID=MMETSP1067-20121228/16431_1 /TAXON_ID=265564 ORGANISM="Thalassiosira punctigera, Strain Tpunct2005C2" /NCGR_SAMPLE_ID=MMETSP1067 /ASSEMBLY_ACC=CAM_ASM_000444 /LENGTH=157 /DNA_ID=CAMNT_0013333699 /DNA_START=57 /DNA_END=526 /DNA_ORIENTATION=-
MGGPHRKSHLADFEADRPVGTGSSGPLCSLHHRPREPLRFGRKFRKFESMPGKRRGFIADDRRDGAGELVVVLKNGRKRELHADTRPLTLPQSQGLHAATDVDHGTSSTSENTVFSSSSTLSSSSSSSAFTLLLSSPLPSSTSSSSSAVASSSSVAG